MNQVTQYQYNAAGQLAAKIVIDPKCNGTQSDNQTTRYIYVSDLPSSRQSAGWTGDQLVATVYPDCTLSTPAVLADVEYNLQYPGVQSGGTAGNDIVALAYYANGAEYTKTDQRGVVHQYDYDALGRETEDDVTSLGLTDENVDGTVQAIVTAYTDSGQTASITSYDSPARDSTDSSTRYRTP